MKKIISMLIAITLILTIGVTAFADDAVVLVAGESAALKITVSDTANGIKVSDVNGFLTISEPVVVGDTVYVNVTAPAGSVGKVTKVVVKDNKGNVIGETDNLTINAPAVPPAPTPETVVTSLDGILTVEDNNAVVDMGVINGISADVYNTLKSANYETITFKGDNYTWTISRGDYTKMNVTASIYFGVDVKTELAPLTENKIRKALNDAQADMFYVVITDNCNIGNVAANPVLVVTAPADWADYYGYTVNCYKFDGEDVTRVATGLSIKPVSDKLDLKLTTGGTYVFTNTVVATPSTPTTKPNAPTGGDMSVVGIVVTALMGAASCGVKKIFG